MSISLWNSVKTKFKYLFSGSSSISSILIDCTLDRTSHVGPKCRVYESSIGRYSYVARNTLIQDTFIGSFCSISENCNIGMPSHPLSYVSTSPIFLKPNNCFNKHLAEIEYEDTLMTTIGNDVWIGAGAQIKSGISIGNGAVIAAGAVVTHDVPPYAIVGGVPAKLIRYRFDEKIIDKLSQISWWNYSDSELLLLRDCFSNPNELFIKIDKESSL